MEVGKLNGIVQLLSIFSTMAVSLTAILGLLSLVFKPIRKCISWVYKKVVTGKSNNEKVLEKIGEVETTLSTKIDGVKTDLETKIKLVSDSNNKNEKNRLRWEILDFANSCKNGRRHTQDEYRHIIEAHDDYETLLELTGDKNGFLDAEFEYIKKLYAERQEKNDFL